MVTCFDQNFDHLQGSKLHKNNYNYSPILWLDWDMSASYKTSADYLWNLILRRTCPDGGWRALFPYCDRERCQCVLSAPAERRRSQPRHWMNCWFSTRHLECSTLHKKALRTFETSSAERPTTQRHTSEDLRLRVLNPEVLHTLNG